MTKVNKPDNVNGGAKTQKAPPPPPKPTAAEIADKKLQEWHCECRKQAHAAQGSEALHFKMSQAGIPHLSLGSQVPIIDRDCREYLRKLDSEPFSEAKKDAQCNETESPQRIKKPTENEFLSDG